jgi:hypothetical protein
MRLALEILQILNIYSLSDNDGEVPVDCLDRIVVFVCADENFSLASFCYDPGNSRVRSSDAKSD